MVGRRFRRRSLDKGNLSPKESQETSFKIMRFSKLTIFIALYIIISASFMLQVFNFIRARIGETGLVILVGLILVTSALCFFVRLIINSVRRKRFNLLKALVAASALVMILTLAWQIENFAERIHVAQFVVLGWFAARDLTKQDKKVKGTILACLFCVVVGIVDEIFQAVLPYRFFDLNDIVANSAGGCWGMALFLITRNNR